MKNHVNLERSKQVKLPDNRILAVELRAFAQTQFGPTEMMMMVIGEGGNVDLSVSSKPCHVLHLVHCSHSPEMLG